MLVIALVVLVIGSYFDLRSRQVPDAISLSLLGIALLGKALGYQDISWASLGLGFLCAFAMGAALFQIGAFGGADVKALAALGALLGFVPFLMYLIHMGIAGGVMAAVALKRGEQEIAYLPAMTLGLGTFLLFNHFGGAIS